MCCTFGEISVKMQQQKSAKFCHNATFEIQLDGFVNLLQNAYLRAEIGAGTAENGPNVAKRFTTFRQKSGENLKKLGKKWWSSRRKNLLL